MKIGVVIGRFQGYTKAHRNMMLIAANNSDKVIVLVGSANRRKSVKNPWSAEERIDAITFCMSEHEEFHKFVFVPIDDYPSNFDWADNAFIKASESMDTFSVTEDTVVTVFGHSKDESSFYLNMFPTWKLFQTPKFENMNATDIRQAWFVGKQTMHFLRDNEVMHPRFKDWVYDQKFNANLQEEFDFYQKEKEKFANYPYPETLNFLCADAVVLNNNAVLMIKRRFAPGKDCWALPGGFKNNNETLLKTALRELKEEANLDIGPDNDIEDYLYDEKVFDDPSRSMGIPRITKAFLFDISGCGVEPKVNAGDDAADYKWVYVADLKEMSREIYDDHRTIIEFLTYNHIV